MKAANYKISYKVDGKKKSFTVTSAKLRDGWIRNMKTGGWRETYTDITWKKVK